MAIGIGRRQFISALGSAAAWPLGARAQQGAVKRVVVLMAFDERDARAKGWLSSFTQGLSELGESRISRGIYQANEGASELTKVKYALG
jgi:hypothetical protein